MNKNIVIISVVVALLAIGAAFYFYIQYSDIKANPQKVTQDEIQSLISKVGKLIVLPPNETPTVATVIDPAQLKGQAFFANASVGDRVLIYTNAGKAILYNPNRNIIVEVAPIGIGNSASNASQTTATSNTTSTKK